MAFEPRAPFRLGIVMQAATKNDVSFLQLIESGLHPPYCALEMARFLIFKSTMEIVHVSPATVFHVRQALTVED
jgi:intracellular sulfur oxidation DsrE/DsrF family protein